MSSVVTAPYVYYVISHQYLNLLNSPRVYFYETSNPGANSGARVGMCEMYWLLKRRLGK